MHQTHLPLGYEVLGQLDQLLLDLAAHVDAHLPPASLSDERQVEAQLHHTWEGTQLQDVPKTQPTTGRGD